MAEHWEIAPAADLFAIQEQFKIVAGTAVIRGFDFRNAASYLLDTVRIVAKIFLRHFTVFLNAKVNSLTHDDPFLV